MASVSKCSTPSGQVRWRCRYRTPDGRSTDRRFKTRREALAYAATVEVDKTRGEYVSHAAGRATVGELAPAWLEAKRHTTAPSHHRTLVSAWSVHVAPAWGRHQVAAVTAAAVADWLAAMSAAGSGPTTVRRAHGVLVGVLADAVRDRRLVSNPATDVQLPRRVTRRHVYLSAGDVHRLADAAGPHRPLVLTLAFCGLRWGEAIALRVRDIDQARGRIAVHANAVQLGARHHVGPTKGRVARSVPVPLFVLAELATACQGRPADALVFPGRAGDYLARPKTSNGWFRRAVTQAGVEPVTPHDLRHTAASLAVSAGASVLAVSRSLGHSDAATTLRVYADLFDADLDTLAGTMHTRYSPDAVGTSWVAVNDGADYRPLVE